LRAFLWLLALGVWGCEPPPPPREDAAPPGTTAARRAESDAVPDLSVPRVADDAVTIDGVLDEAAWKQAASTGPFVDVGTGAASSRLSVQGSARVLWSVGYLIVAFEIEDRDVRGGFDPSAKDPHLWERDTAEIMIDPDGDGDNLDYYEIQIGPQNLVFDSAFERYNLPRGGPAGPFGHESWSSEVESRVVVRGTIDDDQRDEGYVVEARIPWRAFHKARRAPPNAGDEWRMNFYAMENNGGTAWSPILGEGNFHKASRFGRVRFE
jgi:hypothetical protein